MKKAGVPKKKFGTRPKKRPKRSVPPAPPPPPPTPLARQVGVFNVQMKLTTTEYDVLNRIVKNCGFESRSAAMRAALGELFMKEGLTSEEDQRIEAERRWHPPRRAPRR